MTEKIDHALSELVWILWNTLGVAGNGLEQQDWFIDLEVLIILTAVVSESDPRLRDEALDWCSKFHYFVSVSRLKTLVKDIGTQVYNSFSIFAATLNFIAQTKWPVFSKVTPLNVTCSGKSHTPNYEMPALLGLRSRAFWGVGARADLITFFLTDKITSFTAADMQKIGYNKRTLAEVLDRFVQAGLLRCYMDRNQKKYELSKREQLISLGGELPKVIPDWRTILTVIITLRTTLLKCQNNSVSSRVVAVRNILTDLKDQLDELNISPPQLSMDLEQYWDSFMRWIDDTVKTLINRGSFRETPLMPDKLDNNISSLMQYLHRLDDCIDGLEFIVSCAMEHKVKHEEVFKECYQISTCYLYELKISLEDLLKFPIHYLMDMKLSDEVYRYSKEDLKSIIHFIGNIPLSNEITHAEIALNHYQKLDNEIGKIRSFIYKIKERLKELHFRQTSIHLLTNASILYKRHAVLKLFSLM